MALLSAMVGIGTFSAQAKADNDEAFPDPIPMSVDQALDDYMLVGTVEDPITREERRQLLLYLIYHYGGNPWALDPTWMIPMP